MATSSYKRADVYIRETLTQANPSFFPSTSQVAFVGYARRGPIGPTIVDSWLTFLRLFGGFVGGVDDDLAYAVYQFFQNGGGSCLVVRTLGAGVATATRTFNDRQATPASILTVTATNPGAWGNRVSVEIVDTLVAGIFNLNVYYSDTATGTARLVESFANLSMDPASPRNAVSIVGSALTGSNYISVGTPVGWTYSPATGTPATTAGGGSALSGGADAVSKPTAGAAGQIMAGVGALDRTADGFLLNLVGVTDVATINAAIGYVENRGDSMLFIDNQPGRTSAQIATDAGGYTRSSYAALYWPQIIIADPANIAPGTMHQMSPVSSVLGQVIQTDANRGSSKAPAGLGNSLANVMALELPQPTLGDFDTVSAAQVNPIRFFTGSGFCVWGASTLKQGQADSQISIRRTLIALEAALLAVTRFAAFEDNDELLWGELSSAVDQVLRNLWQTRGLRGATQNQAYYVICDDTNNTPQSIAAGEVHIDAG